VSSFSEYQQRMASGEPLPDVVSVPREARPYQGHRAGFFSRVAAAVIDVLAVIVIVVLVNLSIAFLAKVINSATGPDLPAFSFSAMAGMFLLWLAWTAGWATTGRSLGMHIMGVRVVNRRGDRLGWLLAAVRSAFCIVFPVGLAWTIISPANRSIQDLVLRTSVVHDWIVTLADDAHAEHTRLL